MTEHEGTGESSATKNPVMTHCDGCNNETTEPRTQDETVENTKKECAQLKLHILQCVVTFEADREIMSTKLI